MAEHMEAVGKLPDELSVKERNLLYVTYKNAVGNRRAVWRTMTSVEQEEKTKGNEEQAKSAREYCSKVEAEIQKICDTVLGLLDKKHIPKATNGKDKVFFQKMKADYYRYIAEISHGDARIKASQNARLVYEEALKVAEKDLVVADPIRLSLALNYSVFQYEVLSDQNEACNMARTAFEDATAELGMSIAELDNMAKGVTLDNVAEIDDVAAAALLIRLLRNNVTLWMSGGR